MRIDVITLFPHMFASLTEYGVAGRALERGLIQLGLWNPRDFTQDKHRCVDDRPYGGGPGMVMQCQPLTDALKAAQAASLTQQRPVIYLSPQGRRLDQQGVQGLSQGQGLILIAGRYEGIDQRFIDAYVDEEWSIGDYVLSGGELAAMVMIDAMARLMPGALGHQESAKFDSFSAGLLDCPHFTRPEEVHGLRVPEVLMSGDHRAIERWRRKQGLGRTWLKRPDLLAKLDLNAEQQQLLAEFVNEWQV